MYIIHILAQVNILIHLATSIEDTYSFITDNSLTIEFFLALLSFPHKFCNSTTVHPSDFQAITMH